MTWQQLSNESGFLGLCSSSTGLRKREEKPKKKKKSIRGLCKLPFKFVVLVKGPSNASFSLGHEKFQMLDVFGSSLNLESQGHLHDFLRRFIFTHMNTEPADSCPESAETLQVTRKTHDCRWCCLPCGHTFPLGHQDFALVHFLQTC